MATQQRVPRTRAGIHKTSSAHIFDCAANRIPTHPGMNWFAAGRKAGWQSLKLFAELAIRFDRKHTVDNPGYIASQPFDAAFSLFKHLRA